MSTESYFENCIEQARAAATTLEKHAGILDISDALTHEVEKRREAAIGALEEYAMALHHLGQINKLRAPKEEPSA